MVSAILISILAILLSGILLMRFRKKTLAAFNVARRLRVAGMAYLALFFVLYPLAPSCPITGVPIKYEAWYCRNGREGLFSRARFPAMLVNKV